MAETQPGGYYLGADGKPHDAEGEPVKKQRKGAKAEEAPEPEPEPSPSGEGKEPDDKKGK